MSGSCAPGQPIMKDNLKDAPPRGVVHLFAVLLPPCQLAAVAPNALGLRALLQVLALHLPALPPPGVTLHSLPACHR